MMNTETTTFDFSAEHLTEAIERIEKANAKAAKAGISERFTWTTEQYEVSTFNHETEMHEYEQRVALTLNTPAVKIEGWTFVATLTWDEEAGLVTRVVPGQELKSRPTTCQCDVCKTIRRRNDTYVVVNENGQQMQVGHNCLQRFLGIAPKGLWLLDFVSEMREMANEFSMRRTVRRFAVVDVLKVTLAVIGQRGWLSRSAAGYDRVPTVTYVSEVLENRPMTHEQRQFIASIHDAMGKYEAEAHAIVEMVASMTDTTEYITNLKAVCASTTVDPRNIGLLCSAYAACQVRREREAKTAAVVSEYIGSIGTKIEFDAEVTMVRVMDGQYVSTLIGFRTTTGQVAKWFASGVREDIKVGDQYHVRATVKDHRPYNGTKETMITRAALS